jgi:peptidoglycan/xylan/chitin deacetylase (PgdA/CDA1 family)
MYHRILAPRKAEVIEPGMYVTPQTFCKHISFLKNHFRIIPISEAISRDRNHFPGKPEKPLCALTFDDGWRDFYDNAFPILKKYEIPATVFLPTDFIGTDRWFWTDRLCFAFGRVKNLPEKISLLQSASQVVRKLKEISVRGNAWLERAIETLKNHPLDEVEQALSELDRFFQIGLAKERSFISWDEAREMRKFGLISFGSHTKTHRILPMLDRKTIVQEMEESKKKLIEEGVEEPGRISFCYPNGNWNEEITQLVKDAGYSLAVTTEKGWNEKGENPYLLKRIGVHQDISSTQALFACRVSNIL